MAAKYTLDQVREAKHVLEAELDKVVRARLQMFAETTGFRVEEVDVQFFQVQALGACHPVATLQHVRVKLEDI